MSTSAATFAAVDLGATSGRVVVGRLTPDPDGPHRLEIRDVHRFPNTPVRTRDGLHWNILELYRQILEGLRKAVAAQPDLVSIGIDSWAIDYALLRHGRMVGTPYHYRDERTHHGVTTVENLISRDELYQANGLQHLPFSTLYQLAVDRDDHMLDPDTTMLLIPDLIAYWLTGTQRAERTNASTTGLLDVHTRHWNHDLVGRLGLSPSLLPPLVDPGQTIGALTPDIAGQLGTSRPIPVVAVGSHDTASAVVAVPMTDPVSAAYIASGTWSLIGVETDSPILTDAAREANFTNEGGVDGTNRFLRNAMGMWILNECANSWTADGQPADVPHLVAQAGHVSRYAVFDVDDPTLLPAGDMPTRIHRLLATAGLTDPTPAETVRSILESLAVSYARTLDQLQTLTGRTITDVHIVGGASQNTLLCHLIADHTGRTVHAGPVEATATGNLLTQARTAGALSGTLHDLRRVVAHTTPTTTYQPRTSPDRA